MKTRLIAGVGAVVMIASFVISGCEKSNDGYITDQSGNRLEGEPGYLQVRIMDAPSPYNFEAVYLDIRGVSVLVESTEPGTASRWISLTTGGGIYDMLKLTNGVDVVLANQRIPSGTITQIELKLGDRNSIVVDGKPNRLILPDDQAGALRVRIDEFVTSEEFVTLMLDFDVARSIRPMHEDYVLEPALRAVVLQNTGSVHGEVKAARGSVAIVAVNGAHSYSTYADRSDRNFLLRGLPPGTYEIRVYYPLSDRAEVFDHVTVTAGSVTELDVQ